MKKHRTLLIVLLIIVCAGSITIVGCGLMNKNGFNKKTVQAYLEDKYHKKFVVTEVYSESNLLFASSYHYATAHPEDDSKSEFTVKLVDKDEKTGKLSLIDGYEILRIQKERYQEVVDIVKSVYPGALVNWDLDSVDVGSDVVCAPGEKLSDAFSKAEWKASLCIRIKPQESAFENPVAVKPILLSLQQKLNDAGYDGKDIGGTSVGLFDDSDKVNEVRENPKDGLYAIEWGMGIKETRYYESGERK